MQELLILGVASYHGPLACCLYSEIMGKLNANYRGWNNNFRVKAERKMDGTTKLDICQALYQNKNYRQLLQKTIVVVRMHINCYKAKNVVE